MIWTVGVPCDTPVDRPTGFSRAHSPSQAHRPALRAPRPIVRHRHELPPVAWFILPHRGGDFGYGWMGGSRGTPLTAQNGDFGASGMSGKAGRRRRRRDGCHLVVDRHHAPGKPVPRRRRGRHWRRQGQPVGHHEVAHRVGAGGCGRDQTDEADAAAEQRSHPDPTRPIHEQDRGRQREPGRASRRGVRDIAGR